MNLRSVKKLMPWYSKPLLKIVLSKLPVHYSVWKRMGIFEHGFADDAAYSLRVFQSHFSVFQESGIGRPFVGLELGPGDSLSSAFLMHACGASQSYLVDCAPCARTDPDGYYRLIDQFGELGLNIRLPGSLTMNELLDAVNCRYLTNGLESLRGIPDQSVDFIWSQAVLEHLPAGEVPHFWREFSRILRPGGCCSHEVDLRDHFNMALNHLRFSPAFYESSTVRQAGFYVNRMSLTEHLNFIGEAGFSASVSDCRTWPKIPIERRRIHSAYRHFSDQDLHVSVFRVVCDLPKRAVGATSA